MSDPRWSGMASFLLLQDVRGLDIQWELGYRVGALGMYWWYRKFPRSVYQGRGKCWKSVLSIGARPWIMYSKGRASQAWICECDQYAGKRKGHAIPSGAASPKLFL